MHGVFREDTDTAVRAAPAIPVTWLQELGQFSNTQSQVIGWEGTLTLYLSALSLLPPGCHLLSSSWFSRQR